MNRSDTKDVCQKSDLVQLSIDSTCTGSSKQLELYLVYMKYKLMCEIRKRAKTKVKTRVGRPMPKSNFLITNLFKIKQRLKESIYFH